MQTRKRNMMRRLFSCFCLIGTVALIVAADGLSDSATGDERRLAVKYLDSISVAESTMEFSSRSSIELRPYSTYPTATTASPGNVEVDTTKAALKTDPEQERRLQRAEEFAKRDRYDLAVVLWQAVLNQSTDTVMTRDEWKFATSRHEYQKYRSVADEVERTLAKLPKKGLELYRLRADGEARALLAGTTPQTRERALSNVVRKYFVSQHGDDAAFELACRKMDRGEFIGASRLFEKVLDEHPDSDIDRDQILRRLAVAQARVGDFQAARKALAALKENPGGSRALIEMIEADLKSSATVTVQHEDSSTSWPLALGGPARGGHMKSPSTLRIGSGLTELWSREIDLGFAPTRSTSNGSPQRASSKTRTSHRIESLGGLRPSGSYPSGGYVYSGRAIYPGQQPGVGATTSTAASYEQLVERWKQYGWKPAGQMLIDGRRVYFKSKTQLVCLDTDTNRIVWKSLWHNEYAPDVAYQQMAAMMGNNGRPRNPLDMQVFGDPIHQSMALANGRIFSVEGPHPSHASSESASTGQRPAVVSPSLPHGYGTVPSMQRNRTNYLTAYDAKSGKLLWHRAAGVSEKEKSQDKVGFVGSPVPYASLLIAPVADNGEVWVYGLSQDDGKTIWKSKLCDEPQEGTASWSPTRIAVDGGEVYAATGAGVVFALDGMTGSVRWAFRYPRTGRQNNNYRSRYGYRANVKMLTPVGMDEDVVIPHARALVVMASDHNVMFAVDRRSGEFLWDTPLFLSDDEPPVDYCAGVYKDGLYLAGKQTVRRYDLRGGALQWVKKLQTAEESGKASFGRAVVTDDGVYVPVKDSILKLAHESGRDLGQIGVVLSGRQFVGNLYSDGERLFVLNPGRISALGDVKDRLKALDERVKAGDLAAHLERMRIRGRLKNVKGAIDDLNAIVKRLDGELQGKPDASVARVLLRSISELELSDVAPLQTLRLLAGTVKFFPSTPSPTSSGTDALTTTRSGLVHAAIVKIRKAKPKSAASVLLDSAELYDSAALQNVARLAVRDVASSEDAAILKKSLNSKNAVLRRLSIAGLSRIEGDDASSALKSALKDKSERLRLEAAVALSNRGVRDGLPVIADLLESTSMQTRIRASGLLRRITGKRFKFLAYEDANARAAAVKRWRAWIASEGKTAALTPVNDEKILRGYTLLANQSNNFIIEYDARGRITKRQPFNNPSAVVSLPNGHRLVASSSRSVISEFDRDWKLIKSFSTSAHGQPYSLQVLENGNILAAMYNTGNVVEFDSSGSAKWMKSVPGRPSCAWRLENGNTLVCLYGPMRGYRGGSSLRRPATSSRSTLGALIEIDKDGKTVKTYSDMKMPRSASQLENGHLLVVQYIQNRVVELNRKGKVVWQQTGLSRPQHAQRLPDGNTLVVHSGGVTEYNPTGKAVWSKVGSNYRWVHRY